MKKGISYFVIALLLLLSRNVGALEPPFVELTVAGAGFPLTFNVRLAGTNRLVIQESTNLTTWRSHITLFSAVESFRLIDRSPDEQRLQTQFYKAFGNAQSPAEMLEKWRSLNIQRYRFRFSRTCLCDPTILTGTVTVQDGEVVGVEDVLDSGGGPVSNPDITEFRSIEELFDIILTQATVADFLNVRLDQARYFPLWIEVDPGYGLEDDEIIYRASELEIIE